MENVASSPVADAVGVGKGGSEGGADADGSFDAPAVDVACEDPCGDGDGAAEIVAARLPAALEGVPEPQAHALALLEGGWLGASGNKEGLAGAVGVTTPLVEGPLLPEGQAVSRGGAE